MQFGYAARSASPWSGIRAQAGWLVLMKPAIFWTLWLGHGSADQRFGRDRNSGGDVEWKICATATLRFNNGAVGSLNGWAAYQRGTHGMFYIYGTQASSACLTPML